MYLRVYVVSVAGLTGEALPYEALTTKLFTRYFVASGAVRRKITHAPSFPPVFVGCFCFAGDFYTVALGSLACGYSTFDF
jgi:hypothetical protein